MKLRFWRKTPKPFYPPELDYLSSFGPMSAVAIRICLNNPHDRGPYWVPYHWVCQIEDGLPPLVRYMDSKMADAGIRNIMLKGRPFASNWELAK